MLRALLVVHHVSVAVKTANACSVQIKLTYLMVCVKTHVQIYTNLTVIFAKSFKPPSWFWVYF